jgi:antitoxin StbD
MLLNRTDQAISSTDLQKQTRNLLDRIADGSQDRFVVMRDNKPTVVMLAAERYQALIEELDDLRIEAAARTRLKTPRKDYIADAEMTTFIESL